MKIVCTFPTVNISKLNFWLVICMANNFIWTTLKVIFSIFRFFAPSDSRFSNSCIFSQIHQLKAYIFSFQIMHKSGFQKNYSNDWFCCPGSHLIAVLQCYRSNINLLPIKRYVKIHGKTNNTFSTSEGFSGGVYSGQTFGCSKIWDFQNSTVGVYQDIIPL